tara:strand:- start:1529 stop:2140 length:612 start_codon:yes stop_codon:yes gene_type:complete
MKTIKSILSQLILIGLLLLIILTDFLNPIKEYIPILWSILIIWSIVYSLKYKKGIINNELRFPTNNDDYNKSYPFIMGLIIVIGGICSIVFIQEYFIFLYLMTFNGVLLIISGFFFIPSGVIKTKNNELNFIYANRKKNIKIEDLNSVDLKVNGITFTDKSQKKYKIDHLNLKESDYQKITNFINQKLNKKIEIKTYGNTVHN